MKAKFIKAKELTSGSNTPANYAGSDAQKTRAVYPYRVCRAWHLTREVKVLLPGIRRAEG